MCFGIRAPARGDLTPVSCERMGNPPTSNDRVLMGSRFATLTLHSERQRVLALIGVLLFTMTLLSIRLSTGSLSLNRALVPMLVVVTIIAFQTMAALWITRCLGRRVQPRLWFWVVSVLVDCTVPTIGIIVGWRVELVDVERATIAPVAFLYGVFIVLSILRLRPWLTLTSGIVCFAQYLTVSMWIVSVEGIVIPDGLIWIYPSMVFVSGLASAFVSHRLRQSVVRGLEEAVERERAQGEVDLAARIQTGLLPTRPPMIAGYDIAGWNAAASRTGGDFYGWMALPDGRTAVVLADVSGHGLGPAMIAVLCRAYARACMEENGELASVLERLNRLLSTDVPPGMFATLAVVRVAPGLDEVELLSAGHGPILRYERAGGRVTTLDAGGLPLGVDDAAKFEPATRITLGPGDSLVLVSDGVFERRRADGQMYGIERLRALIAEYAGGLSSAALVEAIRAAPEAFAEGLAPQDDVTIVVVKRTA